MNVRGFRPAASVPSPSAGRSLERLKRGVQETLQRLRNLQTASLRTGDQVAARGVGAMIAQVEDLDQRISRISRIATQ